jgi:zinc transport system substrate-binding protein
MRATYACVGAVLGVVALSPVSCTTRGPVGGGGAGASGNLVHAFVSILPQAFLVERVGGARASVQVFVGQGRSPATYEPTSKQMMGLGEAEVYFRIGVPFERAFIPKLHGLYPGLVVVDTQQGIELRRMEAADHHDGDEGDAHDAAARDPHTWLSPRLAKRQAEAIRDELKRLRPQHAAEFDANYARLAAELDALDAEIAAVLAPMRGGTMLVFHPSFGYFADAYGLKQVAIESEGKDPGPQYLARLIDQAKESGARVVFVQKQFSTRSAEVIAKEIGGAVVAIDPLAGDYVENLKRMAHAVKDGLSRVDR